MYWELSPTLGLQVSKGKRFSATTRERITLAISCFEHFSMFFRGIRTSRHHFLPGVTEILYSALEFHFQFIALSLKVLSERHPAELKSS